MYASLISVRGPLCAGIGYICEPQRIFQCDPFEGVSQVPPSLATAAMMSRNRAGTGSAAGERGGAIVAASVEPGHRSSFDARYAPFDPDEELGDTNASRTR